MQEMVIVRERQRVLYSDTMDLQIATQESFDKVLRYAVGPGDYYVGFQASDTGQWEVTLTTGDLILNGAMYRKEVVTVFSEALYNLRPVAQKRIVSIIGYGQTIESTPSGAAAEPRQFIVNTTTRETEVQQVSTRKVRFAKIDLLSGIEQAQPVAPAPGAGNVLICTVLLGTSGIEAVTMNEAAVLPQVLRNAVQIAELSSFLEVQGLRINTLVGDLAATNKRFENYATTSSVANVVTKLMEVEAVAKRALALAEHLDATAQFVRDFDDDFSDLQKSDTAGVGFAAVVNGGLLFPPGATANMANGIELFNPSEPRVKVSNNFMLPTFIHNLRLDTFGRGKIARDASLLAYTTGTQNVGTQVPPRRLVDYRTDPVRFQTGTFALGSFPELIAGIAAGVWVVRDIQWLKKNWVALQARGIHHDHAVGNIAPNVWQYRYIRVRWDDPGVIQWEVYRDQIRVEWVDYQEDATTTVNAQGRAETWLQERDGWLTKVGLFLTQKGASGDIKISITESPDDVRPDLMQSLAYVNVPLADLLASPFTTQSPDGIETQVTIPPVLCRAGKRYALVVLTAGDHRVRMVEDVSAITQGEHFALTAANKWEKPPLDPRQTMAFRLYFARFASTSIPVDLKPLSMAGGITSVSIDAQMMQPPLTHLLFEVQADGSNWRALAPTAGPQVAADLSGAPELLPMRVVFNGTLDIMPAVALGSAKSKVTMQRTANALVHWSEVIDCGGGNTADVIRVYHRLRGYVEANNDFSVQVVTDPGGTPTTENADAVTDTVLPDGTISRLSVFEIPVGKQTFKIKSTGAKASGRFVVEDCYVWLGKS